MILVDTSVWVRFLGNQAPYAERMDALLDLGEVIGHELVYGELLIGNRSGRARLLAGYEKMRQAKLVPHGDIVAFVRDRKLSGRGIGWIDVHLLASAIVERLQVWTADNSLAAVAKDLGVAWEKS